MTRPDTSASSFTPLSIKHTFKTSGRTPLAMIMAAIVAAGTGGCSEVENEPKKPFVDGEPSLAAGQFTSTEFSLADARARYMRTNINGLSKGAHVDWFSYNQATEGHGYIRGFAYRFTDGRWLGERANVRQVGDRAPNGDMILMADLSANAVMLSLRAAPNKFSNEEFTAFRPDIALAPYRCVEYGIGFDSSGATMAFPEVFLSDATFNPDGTGAYTYLSNSGLPEPSRSPRPFNYVLGSADSGGIGTLLISDASPRQAEPLQPILSPGPNLDENFFAALISESLTMDCGENFRIDPADDAGAGNGLERRTADRPKYCNVAAYGAASIDGSVLFASRQFYEADVNNPLDVLESTYTAPSSGQRQFQSQQVCVRPSSGKSDGSLAGAWWQVETYVDNGVGVTAFAELILNDQGVGESRQVDVSGNVAPRTSEVEFLVESNGVINFGGGVGVMSESDNFFIYDASSETGKRGIGLAIRQTLPPDDLAERIGVTPNE